MPRPRKTMATSKGKIGKKNKEIRLEEERRLKLGREGLIVPKWIESDLVASDEFERIVDEAGKIGLLDNLDLSTIVIYCKAYSSYVKLTEHIDKNGYTGEGKDGFEKISPYVTAQNRYVDQIFRCSSKLGLATTDRLKLIVPTEGENKKNKFGKHMV